MNGNVRIPGIPANYQIRTRWWLFNSTIQRVFITKNAWRNLPAIYYTTKAKLRNLLRTQVP